MKKRVISLVLAVVMVCTLLPLSAFAAETVSGVCGDNLTWTYESGVLFIQGEGDMYDYSSMEETPWSINDLGVKYIVIDDGVTSIGKNAFGMLSKLDSVYIPNSLKRINSFAFSISLSRCEIYYDGTEEQWDGIEIATNAKLSLNMQSKHFNVNYKDVIVTPTPTPMTTPTATPIPPTPTPTPGGGSAGDDEETPLSVIDSGTCGTNLSWTLDSDGLLKVSGNGVMTNYDSNNHAPWFDQINNIKKVVIEYGVTSIGNYAFANCTKIGSIKLSDSIRSIGNYSFSECHWLTSIVIPSSTRTIGAYSFYYCNGLSTVTMQDGVISIGEEAFGQCYNLKTVSIPNTVTNIGEAAFVYCESLKSITIPNKLTSISVHAFASCKRLESVVIPDSVTSIGFWAFGESGLKSVTMGTNVKSIDYYAFGYCKNLSDVYFYGSKSQWNAIEIKGSNEGITKANIHYIYDDPGVFFDEYIYRANRMANPNSQDYKYYSVVRETSPCECMAEALASTDFVSSVKAWKAVTTLFDSIKDPSNLWESGLEEKDLYSAIIFNALGVSLENAVDDAIISTEKDFNDWWEVSSKVVKAEFNLSDPELFDYSALSREEQERFEKRLKEAFEKANPEIADNSKLIKTGAYIADGVKLLEDYCEKMAAYKNILALEESMKTVLRQMYTIACENKADIPIQLALRDCLQIIDTGEGDLTTYIMMNVGVSGVTRYLVKELVGALWKEIMDKVKLANPAVAAITIGYDAGKYITNALCSTDDLTEKFFIMLATLEYEDIAEKTVDSLKKVYLTSPESKSAKAFLDSIKFSFDLACEDCDAAKDFCETSDGAALNVIKNWFRKNHYGSVIQYCDDRKELLELNDGLTQVLWVDALKDDYPDSGLYEKYKPYAHEKAEELRTILGYPSSSIGVWCPVNVYVYDSNDNLVAYIKDGDVYAEGNIVAMHKGDGKVFRFYDDEQYRIVCEGYDDGDMDIVFEKYDEDVLVRTVNFNNVAVSNGEEYVTATTETDNLSTRTITTAGDEIAADYDSSDTSAEEFTANISGGYIQSADGIDVSRAVHAGEALTVNAIAPKGYVFQRWTSDAGDEIFDNPESETTRIVVPDGDLEIIAEYELDMDASCDDVGHVFEDGTCLRCGATIGIITQPEDYMGNDGDTARFEVTAEGKGLTYQWYYSNDGGEKWSKSSAPGCKTSVLEPELKATTTGRLFKCEITDENGEKVTSDAVKMYFEYSRIAITQQPESYLGKANDLAEFTIEANAANLKYQWQYSADGGETWSKSSNEGNATATVKVRLYEYRDGYLYRCMLTSGRGDDSIVAYSEPAALNKIPATVNIVKHPKDAYCASGDTGIFTVEATGDGLEYQWQYSTNGGETWGNSGMTGAKTDTLNVKAIASRNGQIYRCKVTDESGTSRYTVSAVLNVGVKPEITAQPESYTGPVNSSAVFTVAATGDELSYQWYYRQSENGNWVKSGQANAQTDTLTVAVKNSRNGYQYRCEITNAAGMVTTSEIATLTVGS